jgi:hypothetical protein
MSEKQVKPSKKGDIIKVVLALLAVLLGTYMFVEPGKSNYVIDQNIINKIDSLQAVNDTLIRENLELDSIIARYEEVIYDLDLRVTNLAGKRSDINDYYNKKKRGLEEQEPTDLDTFFMNRYEYNETIEE